MARVGSKVRAVYDFQGEPGTAELTISSGELLTLTRQDVGEGWWEGVNQKGDTGLFPAAYVEELSSNPPAMPPPPLPESFDSTWDVEPTPQASVEGGDYWEDDDWDEDQECGGNQSHSAPQPSSLLSRIEPRGFSKDHDDISIGKGEGKGPVGRKNLHRFSGFGKTGLESFILNPVKLDVVESEKMLIVSTDGGVMWNPMTDFYTCAVASPKKETKLKGLKSFIAYQITPSFNNIQVSRRYKHFDWLHERLEEKFSLIPIPPLPDKQISGRYEEQFIEHRRVQLQAFVDHVCRHPVLSRSSVWHHFMSCTDEKRWKVGKRKEEKDKLLGANYFHALQAPETPLSMPTIEQETDKCVKFMHNMDGAVKMLMATAADQTKKHQGPYKREYQKIGQAFLQLSDAFNKDVPFTVNKTDRLTSAIEHTGITYNDIGTMFEEQPKLDWEPLGDMLHIYKGIISSYPDILAVHRGTLQKRKECEKLSSESKMDESQEQEVKRRSDIVSYALMAEIRHFHAERQQDFQQAMKSYLTEQISFYKKVVQRLEGALQEYN